MARKSLPTPFSAPRRLPSLRAGVVQPASSALPSSMLTWTGQSVGPLRRQVTSHFPLSLCSFCPLGAPVLIAAGCAIHLFTCLMSSRLPTCASRPCLPTVLHFLTCPLPSASRQWRVGPHLGRSLFSWSLTPRASLPFTIMPRGRRHSMLLLFLWVSRPAPASLLLGAFLLGRSLGNATPLHLCAPYPRRSQLPLLLRRPAALLFLCPFPLCLRWSTPPHPSVGTGVMPFTPMVPAKQLGLATFWVRPSMRGPLIRRSPLTPLGKAPLTLSSGLS